MHVQHIAAQTAALGQEPMELLDVLGHFVPSAGLGGTLSSCLRYFQAAKHWSVQSQTGLSPRLAYLQPDCYETGKSS